MWDIYFLRQCLILVTSLLLSLASGFMLTFPAVLNTSLLNQNGTDIKGTTSQVSWLAASNGFSGVAGYFIISPILQIIGRKPFNFVANLFIFIGWIIVPWATNFECLLAARIIQGLSTGGVYIQSIIVGEYVNPERRGYFIGMKKVFIALGALSCHSMALVYNWRQIAMITSVLPLAAIALTFFWPESPYFLAMKGQFDRCEKSFLWLRGSYNAELEDLIAAQKLEIESAKTKPKKHDVRAYFGRDFMKPFAIVCLLTLLVDLFGRYYFMGYVIQIMVELLGDQSIAIYCSIASDAINIVALVTSCYLISRFERRLLILRFSSLSIFLMILVSFLVFLKKYGIVNVVWLCPLLLIGQSFVINLGVVPVCFSLIGEVFPLQYKGVGSLASGILFSLLYALFMKVTPDLISSTGLEGTFFIFAISALVTLVLLYFILPETKDKSLQQIENELRGREDVKRDWKHEEDGLLH